MRKSWFDDYSDLYELQEKYRKEDPEGYYQDLAVLLEKHRGAEDLEEYYKDLARLLDKKYGKAKDSEEYRKAKYSTIQGKMLSPYRFFLSQSWLSPFFALLVVVFGALVSAWTFFALFVISRLADYFTTQRGLALGAVETNPASEARQLTGFWSIFLFWAVIFGALTLIANFVGSHFLIPVWLEEGGTVYDVNFIQILVGLPIIGYTLMSFAAAINNTFIAQGITSASGEGWPQAAAVIALMLMGGLLALAAVLT